MTREEAISKVKGYLTDYLPSGNYEEVEEIVKALEQESTTKNDLGVDCIDRDSTIKALNYDIKCFEFKSGVSKHMDDIAKLLNTIYETQVNNIKALPSVTPQEPIRPKGKWISYHYGAYYECSNCHERNNSRYDKYCKFCGAKIDGVEEK